MKNENEALADELKRLRRFEKMLASADGRRIVECLTAFDGVLEPLLTMREHEAEAVRMQAHLVDLTAENRDLKRRLEMLEKIND